MEGHPIQNAPTDYRELCLGGCLRHLKIPGNRIPNGTPSVPNMIIFLRDEGFEEVDQGRFIAFIHGHRMKPLAV